MSVGCSRFLDRSEFRTIATKVNPQVTERHRGSIHRWEGGDGKERGQRRKGKRKRERDCKGRRMQDVRCIFSFS